MSVEYDLVGDGAYDGVTYLVSHSHLRENRTLSAKDLSQREGYV